MTIIRVIDTQEEALKYNREYYYTIDGKIKSIYYGDSFGESVKIEIE